MRREETYHRELYIAEGVLSSLLGLCALILPYLFTFGMEQFIGWLFAFLGSAQLLFIGKIYKQREFWSALIIALAHIVLGVLLIRYPLEGIYTLSIWITGQFLVTGLIKLLLVYQIYPQKGWEWLLVGGLSSWAVAAFILFNWPLTAFWLLGIVSGINFLTYGLSHIAFGAIGMESEGLTKS